MTGLERVVFDCNIYFQSLINPEGPAAECLIAAAQGQVQLFCSQPTILEIYDVATRPSLRAKFDITNKKLEQLIEIIRSTATMIEFVPEHFVHAEDPDDSHYVNLALACSAQLIVTRDNDLLSLMDLSRPEAQEFKKRFPSLEIIQPQSFLSRLRRKPV